MKISKSDLGWVAGIIDLKAMIVRKNNKRRKTPQIVLLVDCKEDRVVRRLAKLTGTAPEAHSQHPLKPFMRRGCKEHCKEPHIHVDEEYPWNMPETTRWTLTGAAAAIVLYNLSPYMSTYTEYRGTVDMIFATMVTEGQGSGQVRASVKRLAELGWTIPKKISDKLHLAA